MSAGTVDLEYLCPECYRTCPSDHADECERGAHERAEKRYDRMRSALTGIYAVAEFGLYGNASGVRDAAFALVEPHEVGREGSWEADLEAQARANGYALVGADELEALRRALEAE